MTRWLVKCVVALVIALVTGRAALAQTDGGAKAEPAKAEKDTSEAKEEGGAGKEDRKKEKTIAELTEKCRRHDGLFTVFQDTTDGSLKLLVRKVQIDREYVYFTHTVEGVVSAGHFRGQFRDNRVFSVRRHFNRIELVSENTGTYFDPASALSRAANANISASILASQKILAEDRERGEVLIEADPVFLTEALHQVKPAKRPDAKPTEFALGTLSKDKTKCRAIRNYPKNTDLVVEYVYETPAPLSGGPGVTDARNVSITMRHSLIEMPQNDYQPRRDDPRVGYFTRQVTDLTTTRAVPYRDVIHRWHLKKKDPKAPLSEPVQPIVWWIENTTPVEFRETIRKAVLAWNQAFEKAGFREAVQVKVQPDDAVWDAGDIRYNVLRWTSSPSPPFGGYGPSFVNPRTGEILGADVMLEWVFMTARLEYDRVFESAGLMTVEGGAGTPDDPEACTLSRGLHEMTLFGVEALRARGGTRMEVTRLLEESLYYLALHEVGHTLGLNHNMKASQLHSPAVAGAKEEAARLEAILARSTEPALAFGNDADDMRSPGKAIDPRVNIHDMSSDAIGYGIERIELASHLVEGLPSRFGEPGATYQELRNAYFILTGQQATMADVISRYVGGIYVDRAVIGQKGAGRPFAPVARTDQERAMGALRKYVFAPGAFQASPDLIASLQMQRRGFGFFSETEDPKVHARVLTIQRRVLSHLLHPAVLARLTDSALYGNEYGLHDMMGDLTGAIFEGDPGGAVNAFRRNLQTEYVNRLIAVYGEDGKSDWDYEAQTAAHASLLHIRAMIGEETGNDTATAAHWTFLAQRVDRAMEGGRR